MAASYQILYYSLLLLIGVNLFLLCNIEYLTLRIYFSAPNTCTSAPSLAVREIHMHQGNKSKSRISAR